MSKISHISTIINKRNNLMKNDPNTPVTGVWTIAMEDSTINVRNCNLSSYDKGCIIASNSELTIDKSNFIINQEKYKTIPVVGIKNSKIYWDKPQHYPYLITNQDSFANFPSTITQDALPNTGTIEAATFDGLRNNLKNAFALPRLLNDGSIFYWDDSNPLYTSNISYYELHIPEYGPYDPNVSLENLQKNLHRRELQININGNISNELIIKDFYNGKVILNINDNVNVNKIKLLNLDQVEINGNNKKITNADSFTKSIFTIDNVKYMSIHDLSIGVNQSEILNKFSYYDSNINIINYKYNLYKLYKAGMWKACIETKSSNVVISNCTFSDCYCAVIGACNSMITGENNKFNYNTNITIDGIVFRPICYLSTHNSIINDGTSIGIIVDLETKLTDMNLNDNHCDKTKSFIPGIASPGSFFNHSHKELIPTISDGSVPLDLNNYPPVGSVFATIEDPNYNFSSGSDVVSANMNYGFYYITDNKIKVRKYGNYETSTNIDIKNKDIDDLHEYTSNAITRIGLQRIVPTIYNISTGDTSKYAWVNRTFENSLLFDMLRFNFNINELLNNSSISTSAVVSSLIFEIPTKFYNNFLNNNELKAMIKDCSYNYIYKDKTFNLSEKDNIVVADTPYVERG